LSHGFKRKVQTIRGSTSVKSVDVARRGETALRQTSPESKHASLMPAVRCT